MKQDAQDNNNNPRPTPEAVLEFWFGPVVDGWTGDDRGQLWFGGADNDPEIVRRFGAALARAGRGELDDWATTPPGAVALIVLLDQFTRSVHRGTPRAFANDARALALTETVLARGWDAALPPPHRQFAYMPLMHSEDLARQERCVELFAALAEALPPARRSIGENALKHAREHRDLVARFGRFPHRNKILGRESTPEESEWLTANAGKNYGQSAG